MLIQPWEKCETGTEEEIQATAERLLSLAA